MFPGVDLFASILFRTLCASWTYMSTAFTQWGKFSFIIFSNRTPISCSFSPSGTLWCTCWISWSCPTHSFHYLHFFQFSFLLLLIGCFFPKFFTCHLPSCPPPTAMGMVCYRLSIIQIDLWCMLIVAWLYNTGWWGTILGVYTFELNISALI